MGDKGNYHRSKPNPYKAGSGYPQTDIGKDGVMVKGKWPSNTKQKRYMNTRGAGAATRGKKFALSDNE